MSLQDIAKKMADDFQAEILRFADQKKSRRVYVAKWTESKDFSIRFGHKCFAYNERDLAFDLCRHINKQQGVLNARVLIIDFKNIVEIGTEFILGDVNGDKVLDKNDLDAIVNHIMGNPQKGILDVDMADINKDSYVNAADIVEIGKLMRQK